MQRHFITEHSLPPIASPPPHVTVAMQPFPFRVTAPPSSGFYCAPPGGGGDSVSSLAGQIHRLAPNSAGCTVTVWKHNVAIWAVVPPSPSPPPRL